MNRYENGKFIKSLTLDTTRVILEALANVYVKEWQAIGKSISII